MDSTVVCYCDECVYHDGNKGCKLMAITVLDGTCFDYETEDN